MVQGKILSARCRTSVTYASSASASNQANVSDGMILVVCGERWIGRRESSDLRIELRFFHGSSRIFG
jgi:hypothetical protein